MDRLKIIDEKLDELDKIVQNLKKKPNSRMIPIIKQHKLKIEALKDLKEKFIKSGTIDYTKTILHDPTVLSVLPESVIPEKIKARLRLIEQLKAKSINPVDYDEPEPSDNINSGEVSIVEPVETPVETPVENTEAPVENTTTPVETPAENTETPVENTEAPVENTATPAEAPVDNINNAETTVTEPAQE